MMLPPMVPLQRIRILATSGHVCASEGSRVRTCGEFASWSWVTSAPSCSPPSCSSMRSRPSIRPKWITSVTETPNFIRFTTSMPPAMNTAPEPAAAFRATASAPLRGRCNRNSAISLRERCTAREVAAASGIISRPRPAFRRHTTVAPPFRLARRGRIAQDRSRRAEQSRPGLLPSRPLRRRT